jgi:hypothetical protein
LAEGAGLESVCTVWNRDEIIGFLDLGVRRVNGKHRKRSKRKETGRSKEF